MKKLLLFLMGIIWTIPVFSQEFTYEYEGQTVKYRVLDSESLTCEVSGYNSELTGHLLLPSKVVFEGTEYSLISIGNESFLHCENLESVSVSTGVISIGDYAFADCRNLVSINLPEGLKIIGNGAFNMSGLTSILFPNSLESIGSKSFEDTKIETVILPPLVQSLGENAFNIYYLRKLAYPSSLSSENLPPEEVWVMVNSGMKLIQRVFISYDPTMASIESDGCLYTDSKKTLACVPSTNSLKIPEGTLTIGKNSFAYCRIKELIIPASLEKIEEDAFWIQNLHKSSVDKTIFSDWEKWYSNVRLGNIYSNPYRDGNAFFIDGRKVSTPELKEGMEEIPDFKNVGLPQFVGEVIIPSTIKKIGAFAFYENKEIYSVIYPEDLEIICDYAFSGCELLENPKFPEGLKEIGNGAFAGCLSITEITLPQSLSKLGTNKPNTDPFYEERKWENYYFEIYNPDSYPYIGVFDHCTSLEKAILLSDIEFLGDKAFYECNKLNKVYLPKNLKSIGDYSFSRCMELDEILFPSSLGSIGKSAFGSWNSRGSLTQLVIPDKVSLIGDYAFQNQRIQYLTIGKSLEIIPEGCFSDNPLRSVEFSEGLREIKEKAFCKTGSISSIILPSSLETIEKMAFDGSYIKEMIIPDNITELLEGSCGNPYLLSIGSGVKSINAKAFSFDKLLTLRVKTNVPPSLNEAFNITNEQNDKLTLVVNKGRMEAFTKNARWKQFEEIIEEGSTEITVTMKGDASISEEIFVTTGLMPAVISKMAVVGPLTEKDWSLIKENMPALQKLDLSRVTNLKAIPAEQFAGSLLQEIVFPDKLEEIGSNAFSNCSLLKLDALPETIKQIGYGAFTGCPRVSISRLPSALEVVESHAFNGCTSIRSITGNSNLTTLSYSAFANCSLMEFCDLSETKLERIDDGTFSGCHALEEIILPESVTSIGGGAFSGTAIRDIDFAANVSEIGESAFSNTRRLVSANLPKKIEVLPSNTFSNCPRLIAASMSGNVKSVESNVFDGDSKLANISCSASEVPEASSSSFQGIRMRYVSLTIPGIKFRDYLNATGWGGFHSIQNKIDLAIYDGVDVSNIAESEYQDMLKQDALEEAVRESSADPALLSRSAERRSRQTRAATEGRIFANLFDGAQIQTGNDGTGTRVFINPKPGVTVTSITYDGKELISGYKDNSVLLPAKSKGSLVIKTSEGYTSVDKVPVHEFDGPVEVFDLNGLKIGNTTENLAKGIYVVRQGSKVKKIVVK